MLSDALARISGGRLTLLRITLVLTAALYLPTVNFQFVYDDLPQIVYNPRLQGWDTLPRYFTESTWGASEVVNQYRPVFLLWLRLNRFLFDLSPAGWHLATLALYLLAVSLVYRLARKLTEDEDAAGLTALFFGILPVHMETATWISAASESLYAVFALGAMLLYLDYLNEGRSNRLVGATALFGLALFAKETALGVLPIIAGCGLCFSRPTAENWKGRWIQLGRGLWPFILMSAVYFLARAYALRSFTHFPQPHPWTGVLLSIPRMTWFYAQLLFWPFREHSQFYDVGLIPAASWSGFWLPMGGVLALMAGLLYWAKNSKLGVMAGLCLVFLLLPPLAGTYTFRMHDMVHDRYLYLPAFAVCALLAAGLGHWMTRAARSGRWALRAAPVVALVAVISFFSVRVVREQDLYHDDIRLYTRAVEAAPKSATVWNFLGYAYSRDGQRAEAVRAHEQALRLDPDQWETHAYLGGIHFESGELDQAEEHLRRAAELQPGTDRSLSLYKLGLTLSRREKPGAAEAAFREALRLTPDRSGYHFSLGQSLRKQRRFEEAAAEFQREIVLHDDEHSKLALAEMAAESSARR